MYISTDKPMLRHLLVFGFAIVITLLANSVRAQSTFADNWYISGFGGVAVQVPFKPWAEPLPSNTSELGSTYDPGYVIGAAIGTELDENWRVEGEISYHETSFSNSFQVSTPLPFPLDPINNSYAFSGNVSALNLLANIWYDFDRDADISPYLGAGIGWGFVSAKQTGVIANPFANTTTSVVLDDSDDGFAFQLGAGLRTKLAPNTWLDLGYRFRGVLDVDLDYMSVSPVIGTSTNLFTHTFQVGLTLKFN